MTEVDSITSIQSNNLQTVKQIYRDFLAGDLHAMLEKFSDDIDWIGAVNWPGRPQLPYAGAWNGKEELRSAFDRFRSHVEYDGPMGQNTYVVQGDQILVTGSDYRRDLATGELTENRWSMIWTLEDGKVTRFRMYQDTVESLH